MWLTRCHGQPDEYIDAAIETGAQAIVVSSIYGHGEVDCLGMRERCIERGLGEILLYVGGNLVIGKQEPAEIEKNSATWALTACSSRALTWNTSAMSWKRHWKKPARKEGMTA